MSAVMSSLLTSHHHHPAQKRMIKYVKTYDGKNNELYLETLWSIKYIYDKWSWRAILTEHP